MDNYRWPGYAIENGVLYETAGIDPVSNLPRWRKANGISNSSLFGLIRHLESTEPSPSNWPSQDIIEPDPKDQK